MLLRGQVDDFHLGDGGGRSRADFLRRTWASNIRVSFEYDLRGVCSSCWRRACWGRRDPLRVWVARWDVGAPRVRLSTGSGWVCVGSIPAAAAKSACSTGALPPLRRFGVGCDRGCLGHSRLAHLTPTAAKPAAMGRGRRRFSRRRPPRARLQEQTDACVDPIHLRVRGVV